jgi:anti-sigma regulatory factor (Ser/Thr protein kinase)
VETVELEIPSASAYVGLARLAVSALGRRSGLDEERLDDLKIAVSEACTNAVLSNERAKIDAPVRMHISGGDDRFQVEVFDQGGVFETDELGLSDTQDLRLAMSRALLESLVDECSVAAWGAQKAQEDKGTSTTLVVRLNGSDLTARRGEG